MTFLHSGDLGDIIYSLPSVRALGGGRLLFTSDNQARETMTEDKMEFLRSMLTREDYITDVDWWDGQEIINCNFTTFRKSTRILNLAEWQAFFVSASADIDTAWLSSYRGNSNLPSNLVVFARSPRYHTAGGSLRLQNYLRKLSRQYSCVFVGLQSEHLAFEKEVGPITYYPTKTALDLLAVISANEFFIGNQSFPYSVAEGLKVNTILETFPNKENSDCIFQRANANYF